MPSTATITAFYNFAANTKARASQVNGNFDAFRGHLLPVSPSTATAENNTWDLGSMGYRWRLGYFRGVDLQSNTSTGSALTISGNTSGSNSYFDFKINGSTVKTIGNDYTISGSSGVQTIATTTSTPITNFSVTVESFGLPMEINIVGLNNTASGFQIVSSNIGGSGMRFFLKRNGVQIQSETHEEWFNTAVGDIIFPLSAVSFFDYDPTVGSCTYTLEAAKVHQSALTTTASEVTVYDARMLVKRV